MLKAVHHKGYERISEAVLDDDERSAVFNVSIYLADRLVAAHKYRIGVYALCVVKEQLALCLAREIGVVVVGLVLVLGLVVGECVGVFRKLLIVVRVHIHRAAELLLEILAVFRKVGVVYARYLCECLPRIVSAERLPVVVGAGVDVFICMLLKL